MAGIEDQVRDALAAKAESVRDDGRPRALPAPRRRRAFRGTWWTPVAVAAAIVTVVAGTIVGTRLISSPVPAVRPTPVPLPSGPFIDPIAPPIKQVWPRAVHEIPARQPGERVFEPVVFVGDRVVVGRGLTKNRLDGIWSYDLGTRAFTEIAPLKDVSVSSSVVVGSGRVAWSALRDRMTEIWAVPVTGGVPRRVTAFRAEMSGDSYEGIDLAIADGMAVWSPPTGGVYSVPLTGGSPALVKGTAGYHLLAWPWAGRPAKDTPTAPVSRPMEHLIDMRTGERVDAVPPAGRVTWDDCGPTWCVNGREAWRRDGTGLHEMPGTLSGPGLSLGRFVLLQQQGPDGRQARAVHDVATGRTGILGLLRSGKGVKPLPALYLGPEMVWYKRGATLILVNLTGIT